MPTTKKKLIMREISAFSVVALFVVLLLCHNCELCVMKEKGDYQCDCQVDIDCGSNSLLKPSDDSIEIVLNLQNDLSKEFKLNTIDIKLLINNTTNSMQPSFVLPPLVEFSHPTLISSNIKKENNLLKRIRRNPQNATTIKTVSLNYTVHNNVSSSTTPLSLLVNLTSKTTEKNGTSEKDNNNKMSLATPSVIGKNVNSTNFTTILTNSSSSGMAGFNSPVEKEERQENNRGVDVWIIGSLLFFVFSILAAAYYYRRNMGSQTRRAGYTVRSMIANNTFTESTV